MIRILTQAESYAHYMQPQYEAFLEVDSKKVKDMTPEELEVYHAYLAKQKEEGEAWNREHPVSAQNVIDHYNKATGDERTKGKAWYSDLHHMAKSIANDTKIPMHVMAGLVSNYSPQTNWGDNMVNAARVARTKIAQGGKGEGIMAPDTKRLKLKEFSTENITILFLPLRRLMHLLIMQSMGMKKKKTMTP